MTTQAPATLQDLFDELTTPLGFEVICWEWAGQGKYRVLRLYIDNLPGAPACSEPVAAEAQVAGSQDGAPEAPGHKSDENTQAQGPAPSGVTLQDCSKVSRMLSLALDAAEEQPRWAGVAASLKAGYTLEVSSPGIERPLTKLEHFARFVGQKAKVRCERDIPPIENRKKFSGPILGVTTDGSTPAVRLQDEDLQTEISIPISVIKKAHLLYEGRI